jgi:hypothetical protein
MSESHEELLAMKDAGNDWIGNTDTGDVWRWPFCIVDGCTNRACLRLNSPRCYPHTLPGVPIAVAQDEPEKLTV